MRIFWCQGERHPDAQKTSTCPLLLVLYEDALQSLLSWTLGRPLALTWGFFMLSRCAQTIGRTFLHRTIITDGGDTLVPAAIVSLQRAIVLGGQGSNQTLLGWPLRTIEHVFRRGLRKALACQLTIDVVDSLGIGPVASNLLQKSTLQSLLAVPDISYDFLSAAGGHAFHFLLQGSYPKICIDRGHLGRCQVHGAPLAF